MRVYGNGYDLILHRRVPKVVDGQRVYDDYGNLVTVETVQAVSGIAVWPESASEVLQNVERTNTVYVATLPVTVEVDAVDYLTWLGKDYEIQGEAERYRHPITRTELQTIRFARVEG